MAAVDEQRLVDAIRASWSRSTSADPDHWSDANPAFGQCDVTSLVVLEYLGGDLHHAEVTLDGGHLDYHYWNLRPPLQVPLDLTREQFPNGHVVGEPTLYTEEFIRANYSKTRPDVRTRHGLLGTAVADLLGVGPPKPLIVGD